MADAAELMAQVPNRDSIDYSVLVPNVKGYERAVAANARSVAVTLSCTETMNQRNINMGLDQAEAVCAEVMRRAAAEGVIGRAYLSVAFVCPFEGVVDARAVYRLAQSMMDARACKVIVADTIGGGSGPRRRGIRHFDVTFWRRSPVRPLPRHQGTGAGELLRGLREGRAPLRFSDRRVGWLPVRTRRRRHWQPRILVNMFESAGCDTGISLEKLVLQ